jgi:hypothetical protein
MKNSTADLNDGDQQEHHEDGEDQVFDDRKLTFTD